MSESRSRPYRDGLLTAVGAGGVAAMLLGVVDVVQGPGFSGGISAVLVILGLWMALGVMMGVGIGLVLAAINATWGDGAIGRGLAGLRQEPARDVNAAGAVLAAVVMAAPLAFIISKLAMPLVARANRQEVGALLLGVVAVTVLMVLAPLGLVVYRATRKIAAVIPRVGPLPRVGVLVLVGATGVIAMAAFVVFTKLDWRVLGLGSMAALAALPVLTLAIISLAGGPLRGLREKLPARPALVGVLVIIGLVLPTVMLRRTPSRAEEIAVTEHSLMGARVVPSLQKRFDGDGDGFSNFYGIKDCDDTRADVNPGAREIAGNGIDDNCEGGDRPAVADVPKPTTDAGTPTADPGVPAANALAAGKNVLFIMVDTVRADRLGSAGYLRDGTSLTPNLDKFAAESQNFTRAYSQAPNTPRSLPSMLGSRYPSQIKVDTTLNRDYPTVEDDNVLLLEVLKDAGLRTIGETSHFYYCDEQLDPGKCAGFKKAKRSNIRQGADEWNNDDVVDVAGSNKDNAAERIVPRVISKLAELSASKTRFGMFVHLFEPHSTYMVHDGLTYSANPGLEEKYDQEIRYVDEWIGKLLDSLKASGLDENTVVAIVSDHGEAFGTHSFAGQKMFFHGQTLYDELLRVPMLLRIPGAAPRKVDDLVEVIDLAPTIVDALGLPRPPTWVGQSLVPAIRGEAMVAKPAFGEMLRAPAWDHEAKSMVTADGKWKLFFRISDRRYELYDLTADPNETRDLWSSNPTQGEALRAQMTDWIEGKLAQ